MGLDSETVKVFGFCNPVVMLSLQKLEAALQHCQEEMVADFQCARLALQACAILQLQKLEQLSGFLFSF